MSNMGEDARTTRDAFFNTAEAYRLSAIALEDARLRKTKKVGHADKPVQFLYSHAIELYLKALLRQKHSAETIRDQFRHNIEQLVNEAETLGLVVTAEDRDVFAVMANYTLQEMRYIRTGPKTMLETVELEMLRRASLSVRDRVVEALLRKGDLRVRKDGDALQLGPLDPTAP